MFLLPLSIAFKHYHKLNKSLFCRAVQINPSYTLLSSFAFITTREAGLQVQNNTLFLQRIEEQPNLVTF